jgi:hypothetical protein
MNRIKENLLLPIVFQVTQVPLGLDKGNYMLTHDAIGSIKSNNIFPKNE